MLSLADLRRIFSEFTYRPGWEFVVVETPHEGPHVHINCSLEDAYHPGTTVDLNIISPLPPFREEWQVEDWLLWRLCRIETHEAREWLRRNGQLVCDPHDGVVRT